MNTEITTDFPRRVRYLRQIWKQLGDLSRSEEKPICILGGGQHTELLMEIVEPVDGGPEVACIVDDQPESACMIEGISVLRPEELDSSTVAAVLISSDSIEEQLATRASNWLDSVKATTRPDVVRLYEGLDAGPYCKWTADADSLDLNHLAMSPRRSVLRLPAAPKRIATDPLPEPDDAHRSGIRATAEAYAASGRHINSVLRQLITKYDPAGREVEELNDILDWGCGTGRIMTHFEDVARTGTQVWGCDPDARSVNWVQENLCPPFRAFVSLFRPPLPLPDASFDLVYGHSVFTHISDLYHPWLMELRRITRPDGLVIVSVHDENTWAACAEDPDLFVAQASPLLDFSKPLTDDFVSCGRGPVSQTFWRADGIRRRWSHAFEILGIHPAGFSPTQCAVVMRPRP